MIRIFVEPFDVLIFRTGLPFDAGANSYAPGVFPPSPEPLQGALRERLAHFVAKGRSLEQVFKEEATLLGDRCQSGRFRMRGPFLAYRNGQEVERLYPAPADVVREENKEEVSLLTPVPIQSTNVLTNWPSNISEAGYQLVGKGKPLNTWLTGHELTQWQSGKPEQIAHIKGTSHKQLWTTEPRFGIQINRTSRTVEEGLLYQMEFVRLCPGVGFDVDIWIDTADGQEDVGDAQLQDCFDGYWGRLGGEGRTVRYTVVDQSEELAPPPQTRTRVYLATPTLFADGWQPANWSALTGHIPVAAAVPHYQNIGGWSMQPGSQAGQNKPMQRYVPAGSVYYFDHELTEHTSMMQKGQLYLTDNPTKHQIGYGLCYTGAW